MPSADKKRFTFFNDGQLGNLDVIGIFDQCNPENEDVVPEIIWCWPDDGGNSYYHWDGGNLSDLDRLKENLGFAEFNLEDHLIPFNTASDPELERRKQYFIEQYQSVIDSAQTFLETGNSSECSIS
ncbi:MAG: hypothetical protein AAGB32_00730 [Pseudomonadota bacterium]